MKLEFIDRIKENEILGKNILTCDGRIMLKSGTRLNNMYLKKIKDLGVYYIYLQDDNLDDVEVEDEMLSQMKQVVLNNISSLLKNTYLDSKQMKDSLNLIEDLIEYLTEDADINKSLFDIQTHDNSIYMHSLDVCIMSTFLGQSLGLSKNNLRELGIAAILHDVGKLKISNHILNKTSPLTNEEVEEIKKHPIYGVKMLENNVRIPEYVLRAILEHHERVDGKGYPDGLIDDQICKFAKIISISDVYDTISNSNGYKKNYTPHDAYELIMAGSGIMFDKKLVSHFRQTFAVYPLGCCVKLSNELEGYVIKQNKNFPDRPVIRILYDHITKQPIPFYEIDLLKNINLTIKNIV